MRGRRSTQQMHMGKSKSRKAIAVLACFSLPIAMLAACTETARGLGEACLKGEDCTSGVCVGQVCSESPPLLNGNPTTTSDAAPEATTTTDASDASAVTDAPADSSPVVDASDASGD
jgi:predicted small secreted protein